MEKVERYKAEPRMPVGKPKEWTPADEKHAILAIDSANKSVSVDELKAIWEANKDIADLEIAGMSLKSTVNRKKAEFDGE